MLARLKRSVSKRLGLRTKQAMLQGMTFPSDPRIMPERRMRALKRGSYEAAEARAARSLLQDGDTVLELGAGIGFMSGHLRRHANIGRIVTYEADPELITYIARVHKASGITGVDVRHGVVLANPPAPTVPFYVRQEFCFSSLSPAGKPARKIDVPAASWDAVVAEVRPTALIIDIEGGEVDLFQSCDLGPIQRIVVEIHPTMCSLSGMAGMFESLHRQGFRNNAGLDQGTVLALERRSD